MGLDIYFHRTNVAREDNLEYGEVMERTDNDAKENLGKVYDNLIKKLKKVAKKDPENFDTEMIKAIKRLAKEFTYPEYHIRKLGFDTKFIPEKSCRECEIIPCTLETFIAERDSIIEDSYAKYQAYFRKANFIFGFFEEKMQDGIFSWVERKDVENLIEKCKTILAEKDDAKRQELSEKLLPTRPGFFFGNTEYDKWYYIDVKDCLEQMKQLLKDFDKGYNMYVYFSW